MERIICLLVLISFCTSCFAELTCTPELKQMDNLDGRKVAGVWYVIESKTNSYGIRHVLNFNLDALVDCAIINITIDEKTKSVHFTFSGVQTRPRKQFETTLTGPLTGKGNSVVSGKVDNKTIEMRVKTIFTDKENVAIMEGCEENNQRSVWILSRTPGILSKEKSNQVDDYLNKIGESKSIFSGRTLNYCPKN